MPQNEFQNRALPETRRAVFRERYRWALHCYKNRRRAKGSHLVQKDMFVRFAPFAALALILAASGCGQPSAEGGPVVENVWIRMPAVAGRPGAAYFTIRNGGPNTRLEAVASPQIEGIELHDSVSQGGTTRMTQIEAPAITAGEELRFEPGGKHAMLMKLAPQIKVGGQVPLQFRFSGGEEVKAVATVVGAGGRAPDHAGH